MQKRFIVFFIGICICLLSGCGIDSAMSELANQQLASVPSANGAEEDMAEIEPTVDPSVVLTPETTPTPTHNYNGFLLRDDTASTDEEYEEEEYEDSNIEESEEEDWYSDEAEYIFPNSDTEKLTEADLEGMTPEELRLGRNEIYARHGRCFDDAELQAYFNGQSWYFGSIAAVDFVDSLELNGIERWNAKFIRKHE